MRAASRSKLPPAHPGHDFEYTEKKFTPAPEERASITEYVRSWYDSGSYKYALRGFSVHGFGHLIEQKNGYWVFRRDELVRVFALVVLGYGIERAEEAFSQADQQVAERRFCGALAADPKAVLELMDKEHPLHYDRSKAIFERAKKKCLIPGGYRSRDRVSFFHLALEPLPREFWRIPEPEPPAALAAPAPIPGQTGRDSFPAGSMGHHRHGGPPDVHGSLSKRVIQQVIDQHIREVGFCYAQDLKAHSDFRGRVTVKFLISPTGTVHDAAVDSSDIANPKVEQCIAQAVRRWTFPAPKDGAIVRASYPFVL